MALSNQHFQTIFNNNANIPKEGMANFSFIASAQNKHANQMPLPYQIFQGITSTLGTQHHKQIFTEHSVSTQGKETIYTPENDSSESQEISTPIYTEDFEDKPFSANLSGNSKKIKKEQFRPRTSQECKKTLQEELKGKIKRNPWQHQEDQQVLDLVSKYGQSWALIASIMKDRTGKQIRDRYLNKLKPNINKTEWTEQEDVILTTLCSKMGHKWSKIAEYLPGRTEGQVKNRFHSYLKKRMPKFAKAAENVFRQAGENLKEVNMYSIPESERNEQILQVKPWNFGSYSESSKANVKCLYPNQEYSSAINDNIRDKPSGITPESYNITFNSLNIKLNTFNTKNVCNEKPKETDQSVEIFFEAGPQSHTKFLTNTGDAIDAAFFSRFATAKALNVDNFGGEVKSPLSEKSEIFLSTTRAPSIGQEKELEDKYSTDNVLTKVLENNTNKAKSISLSISNKGIFHNATQLMIANKNCSQLRQQEEKAEVKERNSLKSLKGINQFDFSKGPTRISFKMF